MAELGTIYCNDTSADNFRTSPTIGIETALGRIEASIFGDAGIFDEIAIDLIAPDGRVMQLAIVGVSENDAGLEKCGGEPTAHAYVWNGVDEEYAWGHDIDVSDDSHWYDSSCLQ